MGKTNQRKNHTPRDIVDFIDHAIVHRDSKPKLEIESFSKGSSSMSIMLESGEVFRLRVTKET